MKFSVIIPILKRDAFFDAACASVGAAPDVEMIVVEGVSPAGAARNQGLRQATGEWILFLDGDDVFASGWRAVVDDLIARHPQADLVGFGRTETFPVRAVRPGPTKELDVSAVVPFDVYDVRAFCQFAYRRSLLAGLSFPALVRGEDRLFQGAALLRARTVAVTEVPLYGYRIHPGSTIRSAWTRDSLTAELTWRLTWLKQMTAAGKTMDRPLWRIMGLCLLTYNAYHLTEVTDAALRRDMTDLWWRMLDEARHYPFSLGQRGQMTILARTRSVFLRKLLLDVPRRVKSALGLYHPAPPKTRILFLGMGLAKGGIAVAFRRVAAIVRAQGYEVQVVAPYADEIDTLDIPREWIVGSVFSKRVKNRFLSRVLRVLNRLTGWRFYFLGRSRLPHEAFVVFGASLAPEWAYYSDKPTWGFLHSAPHMRLDTPLTPFIRRNLRALSRRYAGVFAVSAAMQRVWGELGLKSEVMRLPQDAPAVAPRPRHGWVGVGRLSWEKGQDRLIKALAAVPGVELTLVGDGPYRADLEELARTCGVADRVRFVGWQTNPQDWMAGAELFVSGSRTEGLGLAVLEALTVGTPVLATDIPAHREILKDGRYGHLMADSDEGLVVGFKFAASNLEACCPQVPFAEIRAELAALSAASTQRLADLDWTEGVR